MRKLTKKTMSFFLTAAMLCGAASCADATALSSNKGINVTVDGETVEFPDMLPYIEEDHVLVPMRAIFEKMGAEVTWNDGENGQSVHVQRTYTKNGVDMRDQIGFVIGSNEMRRYQEAVRVNDGGKWDTVELEVPAQIVGDRTVVPLRAISEAFGYDVEWDEESYSVTVTSPAAEDEKTEGGYVSKLMAQLPDNENYVISPASLKIAMMMAANGADGNTKSEILSALDAGDLDSYNESVKALTERLNAVEDGEVKIANSVWFNKDYYEELADADFSEDYKKVIAEYYGGAAEKVDNTNSVEKVNEWVGEQTKGKIKNLIPESSREYLAALVNAIYMKADWVSPFEKEATYAQEFTDVDGNKSEKDFMHRTARFAYYEDEDSKIVRMPYTNGLSMYVVLGDTADFDENIKNMTTQKVYIALPKFKTEFDREFKEILQNMGILDAFSDENPKFEPMFTPLPRPVKIDKVFQKAMIEVDEKGTEAAAATAVVMVETTSMAEPEQIMEFVADKPFTYYIMDNESGETLFAGRYVK